MNTVSHPGPAHTAGCICVAAVGKVDDELMALIEQGVRQSFGFETRRLEPLPEPDHAYDPQRGQYSSVQILRDLVAEFPAGAVKLLGVTERDLFIPMLSFLYGQAQLGGTTALVSVARLRQEFYGLPGNWTVLAARAVKETLHELGHTFRLIHCRDRACTMSLSTNIQQIDIKHCDFCAGCRRLLDESIEAARRKRPV